MEMVLDASASYREFRALATHLRIPDDTVLRQPLAYFWSMCVGPVLVELVSTHAFPSLHVH